MKAFLNKAGYSFSSDDDLSKEIKLDKTVLNIVWRLANNVVKQGRHPGSKYIEAIDITPAEKAEAMGAIKKVILSFFDRIRNDPKLIEKLGNI